MRRRKDERMVSPIPSLGRTPARVATRRTVFDPERNDIVDNNNDNGIVNNDNDVVGIPGAAISCLFDRLHHKSQLILSL